MTRICLVPNLAGSVGGPATFQANLVSGLKSRGIDVCFDLSQPPYDAVLVIAGTRDLLGLWRAKSRGVRIVQRLNGMNWIHRLRKTGLRHYLRSERGNFLLSLIRSRFAEAVVYQSNFTRGWWERVYGSTRKPNAVVYNAVDLDVYTPVGPDQRPQDGYRLLLVEGSLMGGHEIGLRTAVGIVERLNGEYSTELGRTVELMVVGKVADSDRQYWDAHTNVTIQWAGVVPRDQIPQIDRSAHLIYPAEINAACPNPVVEALACSLPVVASDTGALPELVGAGGMVVPYGGDPWKLDLPDDAALAEAAVEILNNQDHFRTAARNRAEAAFDLNTMVDGYLDVLLPTNQQVFK